MNQNARRDLHEYLSSIGKSGAAKRRTGAGVCAICGATFVGLTRRRYCSNACRLRASRQHRRAEAVEAPVADQGAAPLLEGRASISGRPPSAEALPALVARLDALRAESRPFAGCTADLINEARDERQATL